MIRHYLFSFYVQRLNSRVFSRLQFHIGNPFLTRLKELQSLSADGNIKSYPQKFIPRLHPQSSAPEFGPSSVLGPGTCFKAYNLFQSQDAWLELKNECYKKLVKKFSLLLSPPSLLLTADDQERGAKAIRAQKTKIIRKMVTL